MLSFLDDVLSRVLEGAWDAGSRPIISFVVPDDTFRTQLQGRTVNMYLAELRENRDLRRSQYDYVQQPDRSMVLSQPPSYFDCHYLISAWSPVQGGEIASPVAEEHALLGEVLRELVRNPDVSPGALGVNGGTAVFRDAHVCLTVAAPDAPRVINDFWSTMKQPWRPTISLVVTAPVDPGRDAAAGPRVVTFVQRTGALGDVANRFSEIVNIGGWVLRQADDQAIAGATVRRVATGEEVTTDAQGRFSFSGLRPGTHRFRASAPGFAPLEQNIDVPAGDAESHVFRLM